MFPITWDDNGDKTPWNAQLNPGTGTGRVFSWKVGGTGATSAFTAPMDEWIHVAVSQGWGTSGNEAQVYLNGEFQKQLTDLSTMPLDSTEHLRLGSRGGLYPFKGLMDDVRIYDSALTGAEVTSLYESYQVPEPTYMILTISGLLMFTIVRLVRRRPAGLEKS